MRISDWSSDVCSSDLLGHIEAGLAGHAEDLGIRQLAAEGHHGVMEGHVLAALGLLQRGHRGARSDHAFRAQHRQFLEYQPQLAIFLQQGLDRSEEPTSELQSLMRISYAVFCLKKK